MVKRTTRTKPKTATSGGNTGRRYPRGGKLK